MDRVLLVGLGGAAGSVLRYLVGLWAPKALGTAFPYATLIVNVVGSFLIAAIMYAALQTSWISVNTRLLLTTGVMGGLTTYSTFNYETLRYIQEGAWRVAITNVAVTLFGCLAAGLLGLACARAAIGR